MKNILTIGSSNSSKSINKTFAKYVGSLIKPYNKNIIDINDFEMSVYSVDRQESTGIPDKANKFIKEIEASDAIIISLAEHNGSYRASFKI